MATISCSCQGLNENCERCDGKGFYNDSDEQINQIIFSKGVHLHEYVPTPIYQINYSNHRRQKSLHQPSKLKKPEKNTAKNVGKLSTVPKLKVIIKKDQIESAEFNKHPKELTNKLISYYQPNQASTIFGKYLQYQYKGEFVFVLNDHDIKDEFCRFWIFRLGRTDFKSKIFSESFKLYVSLTQKEKQDYCEQTINSMRSGL